VGVGRRAEREREPEVHQPVSDHGDDRDLPRSAQRNRQGDQRRLHDAKPGRGDRDDRQQVGDRVRDQDGTAMLVVANRQEEEIQD